MWVTVGWLVSTSLLGLYLKGLQGRQPKEDVALCRRPAHCLFRQQDFRPTSPISHLPCWFPLVLMASFGASTVCPLLQDSALHSTLRWSLYALCSWLFWSSPALISGWVALIHTNLETPGFLLQRIPVLCQFPWKPPIGVCNYVHNCVLIWILYISSTVTDALLITGRISFASSTVNHAHLLIALLSNSSVEFHFFLYPIIQMKKIYLLCI